jgi:L-aspartate oxidase
MRDDALDEWPIEPQKVIEFDPARHRRNNGPAGDCGAAVTIPEVQDLMWRQVGLFRDRDGLAAALSVLEPLWRQMDARIAGGEPLDPAAWREASIVTVGRLIARAALRREESRGGHFRSDFPQRDDIHWKRRASETRDAS